MVKIFKPYEDQKPAKRVCCPGNRYETEYKERYDENGHPYLVEVGQVDTYEKIQSYKDECDIQCILARYAAGDESVLSRPGWYIDTSGWPRSYTEAMNLMNEAHESFDKLPLEVRKKFGMSFEEYMAKAGTDEWLSIMGLKKEPEAKEVTEIEQKQ